MDMDYMQDGLGYRSAPLDPPKYGPVTPQDGLDTQDGLVTPTLWGLRADLF